MNPERKEGAANGDTSSLERLVMHLRAIFDLFRDQIQGLRDIIEATLPYATALDEPSTYLAKFSNVLREIPKETFPEVHDLLRRVAEGEIKPGEMMRQLFEDYEGQGWNYKLIVSMHETMQRQPRLPILRNSLLTAAVASYEATVANVATEFFHYRPEALDMNSRDREKEFSLKELKQFSSIDDAIDFSISKRVEGLMFGSLGDWKRFFADAVKIDISALVIDWPEFQEILQRRHIIVHNGGRASRRYIAQVKATGAEITASEGQPLGCDQAYLEYAIDHLLVAGSLLVISMIMKFAPDETPHHELNDLAYSLLRSGRLAATKRLCEFGEAMSIGQEAALIFKVNRALAIKAESGVNGIFNEISSWDVSALSDRYKLARASLLGDLNSAFTLLAKLVERNEIETENLLEWPLLAEMRADRRFANIIAPRIDEALMDKLSEEFVILNTHSRIIHKPNCRFASAGTRVHVDTSDAKTARRCKSCWH